MEEWSFGMEHEAGEYKVVQHVFGTKAVESCEIMIHPLEIYGDLWRFMGAKWLRKTNATNENHFR